MTTESATIVQRLWNHCNVLRNDGVSNSDESASALLERIQAEKAHREAAKKSKKTSRKKQRPRQLKLI